MQNLKTLIDTARPGRFQAVLLLLCSPILFMDGFDTQAMGYVAPALVADWHMPRTALGPIFSAGFAGLMLGAFILGPVADRFGRKLTLCLCAAIFGVFTLGCAAASSPLHLIVLRFIAGLGLGGAMPAAVALVTEFSPERVRSRFVTALVCCFSIGAAVGGFLAAEILPLSGWRTVFLIGGGLPLVLLPAMLLALPESLRFRATRDPADPVIATTLQRLDPALAFPAGTTFTGGEDIHAHDKSPLGLFAEGRALLTTLIWLGFFMNLVVLYFLASYLPTVLSSGDGIAIADAVRMTGVYQVGGMIGALVIGWLMDRVSAPPLLGIVMAASVAFLLLFDVAHGAIGWLAVASFGVGFCIVGGQIGANAYVSTLYPTALRSTGVAWALGMGRFGSVLGPFAVSALLAAGWTLPTIQLGVAVPACLAGLALFASGFARPQGHNTVRTDHAAVRRS